jgi:hypothetical protein
MPTTTCTLDPDQIIALALVWGTPAEQRRIRESLLQATGRRCECGSDAVDHNSDSTSFICTTCDHRWDADDVEILVPSSWLGDKEDDEDRDWDLFRSPPCGRCGKTHDGACSARKLSKAGPRGVVRDDAAVAERDNRRARRGGGM